MILFPTKKPRRYKYTPRFAKSRGFDFHEGLAHQGNRRTMVLVVLLILLLACLVII